MDGHFDLIEKNEGQTAPSTAMRLAIQCLGGRKDWNGSVHGFAGFIKRKFIIQSTGSIEDGALVFRETLSFDDGAEEKRTWRIFETPLGLDLDADGVRLLQHGKVDGEFLHFVYRLKFGSVAFRYRDTFKVAPNGDVENYGSVLLFGIPVMKIVARATCA